ncbi:MAG: iron dependent repressor, metal binding and dimerization domain protein [Candidatus Bathyarchaeota archaeon]
MEPVINFKLSACEENYIETIHSLIHEHGYARVADIASALEVKPPSVTSMLKKLDEQKFVNYTKYRGVVLTSKGKLLAQTLENRQNALKTLLVMIGVSKATAEKDACKIEHKIDQETMEKLVKFVEFIKLSPQIHSFLSHFRNYNETVERQDH